MAWDVLSRDVLSYIHFVYAAIALVSLRILADSEPSLVDNAISNRVKLLCTGIIVCLFAWSQSTIFQ